MKNLLILFYLLFSINLFCQDVNTKIYQEKVGDIYYIYADNFGFSSVSVEFNFKTENMDSSLPNKAVIIVPPQNQKFVISKLSTIDQSKSTKFSYEVYFVRGDVLKKNADLDYVYFLPFEKGKTYMIYQGYNGNFSHQNAFSLDFSLKEGNKVFSSRDGKIVEMVVNNSINCLTKDCASFNNKIIVLHNDGSFGEYVHLKQNGACVKVGDEITKGQLIGYSGNTGWSKGPHLHFSVFYNNIDGTRTYIKTKFLTAESKTPILLQQAKNYTKNY